VFLNNFDESIVRREEYRTGTLGTRKVQGVEGIHSLFVEGSCPSDKILINIHMLPFKLHETADMPFVSLHQKSRKFQIQPPRSR